MNIETLRRFNDVDDLKLRVYNRTVTLFNLSEDFGPVVAEEYLGQFSDKERSQMLVMANYIKHKGADETRKEVMANVPAEGYDEAVN